MGCRKHIEDTNQIISICARHSPKRLYNAYIIETKVTQISICARDSPERLYKAYRIKNYTNTCMC